MAYFLGHPDYQSRFAWTADKNRAKGWGKRMKEFLTALSYQWVDGRAGILEPPFLYDPYLQSMLGYNVPSEINMAYNGAYGPMNSE